MKPPPPPTPPRCPACGKLSFPTRKAAIRKASRMRPGYGRLRPYRCPLCRAWHLTSQAPRNATVMEDDHAADA
jgi:hypothetical protein